MNEDDEDEQADEEEDRRTESRGRREGVKSAGRGKGAANCHLKYCLCIAT